MEGNSQEVEKIFVTPHGGGPESEFDLHPSEMKIVEQPNGVLEVHDPLFEYPYKIGDRSYFTHPTVDDFIRLNWLRHGIHASARHLSNPERHETKIGAGRWSSMQHEISTAALAAHFGASPQEIMHAAIHDAGKRKGAHKDDDQLQGRGKEDQHDKDLAVFLNNSGFGVALEMAGLVPEGAFTDSEIAAHRRRGELPVARFVDLDVAIDDIFGDKELEQGIMNWPGRTGNLEVERVQYIVGEGIIYMFTPEHGRELISHIYREPDSPEGDQLIVNDIEAAGELTIAQIRACTEHWQDNLNELLDELLNCTDRYMLLGSVPDMAEHNKHHPADVLYTLNERWGGLLDKLGAEDRIPFVRAMLKITDSLAAHQRKVHAEYSRTNLYKGPVAPDWIKVQNTLMEVSDKQVIRVEGRKKYGAEKLIVEMKPGKPRAINPWTKPDGRPMKRIETYAPSVRVFRERQTRWMGYPCRAVIDLCHPALGLTDAERKGITVGISAIDKYWESQVLKRPRMTPEEFETRILQENDHYRQIGQLSLIQSGKAQLALAS